MQSFVLLAIRTAEAIKKSRRRTGLSDLHAAPYNLFKLFAHYGGAAAGASSESVYCVVPRIAVAVEEEEEEEEEGERGGGSHAFFHFR